MTDEQKHYRDHAARLILASMLSHPEDTLHRQMIGSGGVSSELSKRYVSWSIAMANKLTKELNNGLNDDV